VKRTLPALVGATGIVYGDIGTSPIYAFELSLKATGSHGAAAIFGVGLLTGAALGVPTVSLFGPNEPASIVVAPHQRVWVQQGLQCRPCNRLGKVRCPLGHHRCMRDTTSAQVLSVLEPLLALGELRLRAQAAAP